MDRRIPLIVPALVTVVLAPVACAPTQNHAVVTNGHVYQRIVCRASTPGKCMTRAREVCGEYSVVEPLQKAPGEDSVDLTMTVECHVPTVGPAPLPDGQAP
jgi:hypothetical protein